jgi:hypothetical protein
MRDTVDKGRPMAQEADYPIPRIRTNRRPNGKVLEVEEVFAARHWHITDLGRTSQ